MIILTEIVYIWVVYIKTEIVKHLSKYYLLCNAKNVPCVSFNLIIFNVREFI